MTHISITVTIGRMKGRGRDIAIGIVILIVGLLVIYLFRHRSATNPIASPVPTQISAFQQSLQNNFNITVPDNVAKADLKNTTDSQVQGIATADTQNGKHAYTVIADLEDPAPGYFYEGWLVNGNDMVPMGILYSGKGGWMVTLDTAKDLGDHKTVWVTLERINDKTPEKHILEGSFQ